MTHQRPEGPAAVGRGDSNSGPPCGVLPAHGRIAAVTCDFSEPVVTAVARSSPLVAARVCTQRVPLAPVPGGLCWCPPP